MVLTRRTLIAVSIALMACGTVSHSENGAVLCVSPDERGRPDDIYQLWCDAYSTLDTACFIPGVTAPLEAGSPLDVYDDIYACWGAADACIDAGDCPEGVSLAGTWRDHRTGETLVDGAPQGTCTDGFTELPIGESTCAGTGLSECYWGGVRSVDCRALLGDESASCVESGGTAQCVESSL